MLSALLLLASQAPALACTSAAQALLWPDRFRGGDPSSVVWIDTPYAIPQDARIELLDPSGGEVSFTRIDLSDQVVELLPDAPLPVGEGYAVEVDGDRIDGEFDIHAERDPTWGPPVPQVRTRFADYDWRNSCEDVTAYSGVRYNLCTALPVVVFAVGEQEPGDPSEVVVEGLTTTTQRLSEAGVWPDAGPGATATIWIGGFEGSGRFTGWISDEVTLPASGTVAVDTNGALATGGTIPTTVVPGSDCDPFTGWVTEEDPAVEEGEGEGEGEPSSCGCGTGGPSSGALALLIGLAAVRRVRRR